MAASALSAPSGLSIATRDRAPPLSLVSYRKSTRSIVSALTSPSGLSNGQQGAPLKLEERDFRCSTSASYGTIQAVGGVMPAVMTPVGPVDLATILFRNRTIFIGQYIDAYAAQQVISQLVTLATIDENADIWVYLNTEGGDPYDVFAVYDCMCWVKPKVGTICFGTVASHATLILAGAEKGMRKSMPNTRIMIEQPQGRYEGALWDVKRQVNEVVHTKNKIDKMYAAFTGQPLDLIQTYTGRAQYFSAAEAKDFGLIDELLETAY